MSRRRNQAAQAASPIAKRVRGTHATQLALLVGGLWLLMLATTPFFLVQPFWICHPPDISLLGMGRTWNPPLAGLATASGLLELPLWLATLAVAWLLATALQAAVRREPLELCLVAGAAALASLPSSSLVLVDVLCLWLVGKLATRALAEDHSAAHRLGPTLLASVLIGGSAILTSLEFGLILGLLTATVIVPVCWRAARRDRSYPPAAAILIGWLLCMALPAAFGTGYLPAMARPLSWLWLQPAPELLPSMCLIWRSPDVSWLHLLAGLVVLERLRQALLGRYTPLPIVAMFFLMLMALGCAKYFMLSMMALLVAFGERPPADQDGQVSHSPIARLAPAAVLGLGLLAMIVSGLRFGPTLLASDVLRREIDISQWNVSGPVLLTNLEHATRWQHPKRKSQFRPVLSDRWDVFHDEYADYQAVCDDWKNWKREAYLRSDGQWGGYQQVFADWQPVLVAVDSHDLPGIHRVSLDSKWKTIGIDYQDAIFASAEATETKPYVQFANRLLLTLEFPRPTANPEFERVVVPGSPADAHAVSAVLSSLRLAYAGLRVLPQPLDVDSRNPAMLAWAELAHRSQRYSGQFSLLDSGRALGPTIQPSSAPWITAQTRRYRATILELLASEVAAEPAAPATAPLRIRRLIAGGRFAEVPPLLTDLPAEQQQFFKNLLDLEGQSPAVLRERFQRLAADLSTAEYVAECHFYAGCLAIELGDVAAAQNSLAACLQADPDAAFAAIAQFYLSQIQQ